MTSTSAGGEFQASLSGGWIIPCTSIKIERYVGVMIIVSHVHECYNLCICSERPLALSKIAAKN